MYNWKRLKQFTALCVLSACLITGCSNTNSSKDKKVAATEAATATPAPTIDTKLHSDNLMGIYIGKQQSQIGLGLDTATVKEILGKADKTQKATTTQKKKKVAIQTWYYKDLDTTLTFTKADKTYTLSSIVGGENATTLQTGGGIAVGATREDIEKAYKEQLGKDTDTKKNKIVIDNMDYSRLVFTLQKDTVVSVCMELL